MQKRSTLLKVVCIIMIIFAIIAIVSLIASMSMLSALSAYTSELGISTGVMTAAVVIGIVSAALELVFAILGLISKNKKLIMMLGLILIIIAVISLIISIAGGSFSWTSLVSLILPVLYYLGARQCVQ